MTKPLVRNAADKKQVNKAGKREKELRELELEDFRQVMSTEGGRRTIYRYLQISGIYSEQFTGNSQTFYLLGQRSVGLILMEDIKEASKDLYLKMLTENIYSEEG